MGLDLSQLTISSFFTEIKYTLFGANQIPNEDRDKLRFNDMHFTEY